MGNDSSAPRQRSQTAGGPAPRDNPRNRAQTVIPGYPPVTENDFLREKPKNPTEQDFLTREPWKGKESEVVRKRNDDICSKVALGFAQVDTDRDGFIDQQKVNRIYKQVCKLANAVYATPIFPSNRVGFLQWNNLFKNIPASDKQLTKALQKIDFLSFKDPGETVSTTKSYLDVALSSSEPEAEKQKKSSTSPPIPRKQSTGTNPKPVAVTVHSPPSSNSSLESKQGSLKDSGATRKPRKGSNVTKATTSVPPILPTGKRPTVPNKTQRVPDKRAVTGLRPPVGGGRRSRANTGDSDVSAVSSVGDIGDLDDITDTEEADYGTADADIPSTQSKPSSISSPPATTTSSSPAATSPPIATTSSPPTHVDDDDDDDTNSSIIARANAVWS